MADRDSSGLIEALKASTRDTRLAGTVPDPIAEDVLKSRSVNALDAELASQGLRDLRPLGGGASSVVLDGGDKVVRIGIGEDAPRPNLPEVLQAERHGTVGNLRFEVLPKAETKGISEADVKELQASLKARGYEWDDAAADNAGRVNGRLVVTDPGGVTPAKATDLAMESAYRRVERDALERTEAQEQPRAVILGGQAGSGKSELAAQASREFKQRGGAVIIDADRMREENPRYKQLSRDDPQNAADRTHREAGAWSMRLTTTAIENRRNLVVDGTMRDPDSIRVLASRLKSNGYKVEARVMAVDPEVSMARARLRFEEQVAERGTGRFVNQGQHDRAYAAIPDSVRALEAEKRVDRMTVYDANHRPIYENSLEQGEWQRPPQAARALERERGREWSHAQRRDYVATMDDIATLSRQRTQQPDPAIEGKLENARQDLARIEQTPAYQRADAFDRLPKGEALARHPELDGAYAQLRDLRQQTAGASQDHREQAYFQLRAELSEQLHRGEIPKGSVTTAESERVIEMAAVERGVRSIRDQSDLQRDVRGEVVAESSQHVLVKMSGNVGIRVEKTSLDREPQVGERVTIQYGREQSKVYEQGQEPARDQARESSREFVH